MDDERIDAHLAALLAPPLRTVDEAFAARTLRLVALEQRAAAARQESLHRTAIGIAGTFGSAAGLALFAATPAIATLGTAVLPVAMALLLLVLAAQSPALTERG